MDVSTVLLGIIIILGATVLCVILFERLGFGAILGFIAAGIVIGPHTPGPVPVHAVEELHSIAELGVVLFMFTIGLEMRPEKVWAMRRLIFGLGSAQVLATAVALAAYLIFLLQVPWETAAVIGLAFSMSSTAIVMATLGERGELSAEHGRASFAVLMAQDMWVVPIMAAVPILAHATAAGADAPPLWEKLMLVVGVTAAIVIVGRYLMPAVLGYCASRRQLNAFGLFLFLAILTAAWAIEHAGISMTLGAFLLGMLLSASDFRYQIEATVAPFKETLMGLFFIAVGMSIDVDALKRDWESLLIHVPVVLVIKGVVLVGLMRAFGVSRPAAIRAGFYLSQVGEFAFVLLGAAAVSGLLRADGQPLAMLVVAASMVLTPFLVKGGNRLAGRIQAGGTVEHAQPAAELNRHVVVVGYEEVGQLVCLMLSQAGIPHLAVDKDIGVVRLGRQSGGKVYFGDMKDTTAQEAAGLSRAAAVYVTSRNVDRAKALAVTLYQLYPQLNLFVHVRTLQDQEELQAKGIKHAGTNYIESTLARGSMLLKELGMPVREVDELLTELHADDFALIRGARVAEQ